MKMNPLIIFVWYAVWTVLGRLVIGMAYNALLRGGHVRANYKGVDIPTSVGLAFALAAVVMAPAAALLPGGPAPAAAFEMLALCLGFALLGLLDDLTAGREKGGFKGHLKTFFTTGHVSTALIKAGFGVLLCAGVLLLRRGPRDWPVLIMDVFILALSANAMNLLDVRPGRTLKGFLGGFMLLIGISIVLLVSGGRADVSNDTMILIVPFALWAVAYWPLDLKRRAMLGDTGSNVLGVVLGLALVWDLSVPSRLAALGVLVFFHIITEITSLTKIIEAVPPLKWLDRWGVPRE